MQLEDALPLLWDGSIVVLQHDEQVLLIVGAVVSIIDVHRAAVRRLVPHVSDAADLLDGVYCLVLPASTLRTHLKEKAGAVALMSPLLLELLDDLVDVLLLLVAFEALVDGTFLHADR